MEFIYEAVHLHLNGQEEEAIDLIFWTMDTWFHQGEFEKANVILHRTDPFELPLDISLGLATISLVAKSELSSRHLFMCRLHDFLKCRYGEEKEELLRGLW